MPARGPTPLLSVQVETVPTRSSGIDASIRDGEAAYGEVQALLRKFFENFLRILLDLRWRPPEEVGRVVSDSCIGRGQIPVTTDRSPHLR